MYTYQTKLLCRESGQSKINALNPLTPSRKSNYIKMGEKIPKSLIHNIQLGNFSIHEETFGWR